MIAVEFALIVIILMSLNASASSTIQIEESGGSSPFIWNFNDQTFSGIIDLNSISGCNFIKWMWDDPINSDFSKTMVYIDGIFMTNVTGDVHHYRAAGLVQNTNHRINLRTVDSYGNIGAWVNDTAKTMHCTVLIINDDNDPYFVDDQSVSTFKSTFKRIGYKVSTRRSNNISNSVPGKYDIIIWSNGDDVSAINNIENEKILVNLSISGAHLLIESGNAARWMQKKEMPNSIDDAMQDHVFHITSNHVYSDTGNLTLASDHPIATTPYVLPETIGFTPTDHGDDESGDADAVRLLPDTTGVYNWSYVKSGGNPVIISVARRSFGLAAYDDDTNVSNGGQIVYIAFDIDDIDSRRVQRKLIENSEKWLRG